MMKKSISILFFVLVSATSIRAQKINVSGSWTIQISKSDFQDQSPAAMYKALDIKQTADSLIVVGTRFPNPDNPAAVETISSRKPATISSYPLDGKVVHSILPDGRKMTASVHFSSDNQSLIRNSAYTLAGDLNKEDYKSEEIWTLSPDGKTLTLARTFSRNGENLTIKAVYERK